mmetsp:Transcript_114587/g.286397  ORF Transcript_114587/g.286397 Transcript_114587/m.286397 type:complete len:357 (-) Transcript_114587:75-1145(-)
MRPTSWLSLAYSDTIFNYPRRRHPRIAGLVALTIDDGLCRQDPNCSLVAEVRDMLRQHGAKATFMLCSDYLEGVEEEARGLLEDGHEFGNHCPKDREYYSLPPAEFEEELLKTNRKLESLLGEDRRVRWFRAPQAKYSSDMKKTIHRHGLRHALGNTYCDDWAVSDGPWVAATMLRQVDDGSILIIHMPERGFREHTLEALRLILEGLTQRGLRAVTLSTLAELAEADQAPERPQDEIAQATGGIQDVDEVALPELPPDVCKTSCMTRPVGGIKEQRTLADGCSEAEAQVAAVEAVLGDPGGCIVEITSWWTPTGGRWCAKAFTAESGQSISFEQHTEGRGYLVYHSQSRSIPQQA